MTTKRTVCGVLAAMTLLGVLAPWGRAQEPLTADVIGIPLSPNREDVKAIGMGRTQLANGRTFNGMLYNPALLARPSTRVDILNLQVDFAKDTPDAIAFLRDNYSQFTGGQFYKDIDAGVKEFLNYLNGVAGADQQRALGNISKGLNFTREFQEKILGTAEVPKVHGATILPAIQVQVGNFGFSLYGTVQSGFQSAPTQSLTKLYSMQLPNSLEQLTEAQLMDLLTIVDGLIDPVTGNLSKDGAIPVTFAVAFVDVVASGGYGRQITPELGVGGALKVVNRRFSNKIIDASNYDQILSELRSDFNASVTGVTVDLGAIYRVPRTQLDIGLSLQNVIPTPKLTSTATLRAVVYDQNNVPVNVPVRIPFELTMPFLANLGANYRITKSWDASLDWVDIVAQDDKFENYLERFRIGTEYRLETAPGKFGVAFRAGLATKRPTAGLGLNIFNIVQIDGAYAYDLLFAEYAWYGQIKFGW